MKLKIATRGSALALVQARWVAERLKGLDSSLETETVVIKTSGDLFAAESFKDAASRLPDGKGLFVKEIEEALLKGEADLAVHSAKDLPGALPDGLALAAIPEREDARDVFWGREGLRWKDVRSGHKIASSSLRRQIQLCLAKPGVETAPVRGNVDTRLKKIGSGAWDGLILAAAGLKRLSRYGPGAEPLPVETMVPAPGQGALALEMRRDHKAFAFVGRLDHAATRAAVEFERAFSLTMGGGCSTPLGAYAECRDGRVEMRVFWAREDGSGAKSLRDACDDLGKRDAFLKNLARSLQ